MQSWCFCSPLKLECARPWDTCSAMAAGKPSAVELAAGSDEETVILGQQKWPAMRSKKGSYADMVGDVGPNVLAVLVGQPKGRWWPELRGKGKACRAALRAVSAAADGGGAWSAPAHEPEESDLLVGLAVIEGWRCVRGSASHADTYALMQASEAFHRRRSGQRFLEHRVVSAASLGQLNGSRLDAPSSWVNVPAGVAGPKLLQHLTSASLGALARQRGSELVPLGQLLSDWEARYGVSVSKCFAWPVTMQLAVVMASGLWFGDVSVRHRRQLPTDVTMAPSLPSEGLLRFFVAMDIGQLRPPKSCMQASERVWDAPRGFVKRYHPAHALRSLRMGMRLRSQEHVREQLVSTLRFLHPSSWQARLATLSVRSQKLPHPSTQRRGAVRLDLASMLARRQWYRANGPTYRYLAYDASPQRGHEFFVTVERVVRRSEVALASFESWPAAVESRLLPLCVLGHGRMGSAEKVQTHIHQVWLDYGPAASDVRTANLDVRQCLSDMGTEFAICDAADVVAQCIGQPGAEAPAGAHLYPFALAVPGPQHIIDLSLRYGLHSLSWWPAWQRSAKVVCQWLRSASHRHFFQVRLRSAGGDPAVVDARVRSLSKGCNAFAEWRWKTLASVTADLQRMQEAVRAAAASVRKASEIASQDGGQASDFLRAVREPDFWARASVLGQLVAPLAEFSSWVRGCDCHEEQRRAHKAVVCDWQGCRARTLASRTQAVTADLRALREKLLDAPEAVAAVSTMMSTFQIKMAWVFEEPYLIWQVRKRETSESHSAVACVVLMQVG